MTSSIWWEKVTSVDKRPAFLARLDDCVFERHEFANGLLEQMLGRIGYFMACLFRLGESQIERLPTVLGFHPCQMQFDSNLITQLSKKPQRFTDVVLEFAGGF